MGKQDRQRVIRTEQGIRTKARLKRAAMALLHFPAIAWAQMPPPHWALELHGSTICTGVVADSSDGCWVWGPLHSALITGNDTLLLQDAPADGYLVKFNYAGTPQWARSTSQTISSMIHRPSGSMRLFAPFTGTFTVGDSSVVSPTGTGLAVADLAADGSVELLHGVPDLLWAAVPLTVFGVEQLTDGSSDLVIYGAFTDSLRVLDTLLIGPEGSHFMARISWNGVLQWAVRIGSASPYEAIMVQNHEGQLIIAGESPAPASPTDTLLPYGGVFVASFAPDGTFNWSHAFGDEPTDHHAVVDVDTANNVLFGYSAYTGGNFHHLAVMKIDASGAILWSATTTGAEPHLEPSSVLARPSGDIVVAGWAYGDPVQFGDEVIDPGGFPSSFFATLDSDGTCTSVFEDNGDGNVFGPRMSNEMGVSIYAVGYFENVVNYGQSAGPLVAPSGTAIFIVAFSSSPMDIHPAVSRSDQLLLYPNPVNDWVYLRLHSASEPGGVFMLHNSTGQAVRRFQPGSNSVEIELNISEQPSGLYLLKYVDQHGLLWESKFIKE
jgi:hypothetical protein